MGFGRCFFVVCQRIRDMSKRFNVKVGFSKKCYGFDNGATAKYLERVRQRLAIRSRPMARDL